MGFSALAGAMLKWLLAVVGIVVLSFVGVTFFALEYGDVAVVETLDKSTGKQRLTHIWHVHTGDQLFLEGGSPTNPWVQDLEYLSTIRLIGNGIDGEYAFVIRDDADNHAEIRALMRAKYGWRDRWVGIVFDTSKSMLIEVVAEGR